MTLDFFAAHVHALAAIPPHADCVPVMVRNAFGALTRETPRVRLTRDRADRLLTLARVWQDRDERVADAILDLVYFHATMAA